MDYTDIFFAAETPANFDLKIEITSDRTGVDGNHRMYMVDVDPATGALSYDQSFRDEETGTAAGVDFNRRNWPNHPDAGFYKPHAMVWVCPPGICPA